MSKGIPEKRMFHQWAWSRLLKLWFWRGQIICRLVGHRINQKANYPWCGRCGIAFEEIYGLEFYNHYTISPKEIEE